MNGILNNFSCPEKNIFSFRPGTLLILGSLPFEVINYDFRLPSGCLLQTSKLPVMET